jgi:tellurite resistance protein
LRAGHRVNNLCRDTPPFQEGDPVTDQTEHPLSPQDCLVALMIAVSASDENIRTVELIKIQATVNLLPIFAEYDVDRIGSIAETVFDLLEQEDGLDALFGLLRDNLPERLNETAYALACDVAAADGILADAELRLLEEIRYELDLDRLHAAAIERGARARHLRA